MVHSWINNSYQQYSHDFCESSSTFVYIFNDRVDSLAKLAIQNQEHVLTFLPTNMDNILYFPRWKGLLIEDHLRHFIVKISRNCGFENWLNIRRNQKYRSLEIDWHSTFKALNDDKPSAETSFFASNRKVSKLKFLIEELPTLEHMKLCRPDLYKDWNCVMCHNDKENFNHVWTCDQHLSHIQQIIYNQKKALIQLVKEYTKGNKLFSFTDLVYPTLWSILYSFTDFTFIDIIKGVVPAFLFNQINRYINNSLITQQILSVFLNRIYLDIMLLI